MMLETRALEQRDRAFRVAEAEPQCRIEIVGRGKTFVEPAQRGVQIRSHETIEDATVEIAADRDLQPGGFEYFFRRGDRRFSRCRLPYEFDQCRWIRGPEPEARETHHVRPFESARFTGVYPEAFATELDHYRGLALGASDRLQRLPRVLADDDDRVARRFGFFGERMRRRESAATARVDDLIQHVSSFAIHRTSRCRDTCRSLVLFCGQDGP